MAISSEFRGLEECIKAETSSPVVELFCGQSCVKLDKCLPESWINHYPADVYNVASQLCISVFSPTFSNSLSSHICLAAARQEILLQESSRENGLILKEMDSYQHN